MDEVSMGVGAFVGIIIFAWFAWISFRLEHIGSSADDVNDRFDVLEEALAQSLGFVVESIKKIEDIKEWAPNLTVNQNPLQPLIESILGNIGGAPSKPSSPEDSARDSDGTFVKELIDSGEKEETH